MKNAIYKTALTAAALTAICSCNVKRSSMQHNVQKTTETASINRAAIKSALHTESVSASQLKIYEIVTEKDTCGHTLKETRRTYDYSGHSASTTTDTTATVNTDSTVVTSALAWTATEEKTSKPATLSLAMTIAGIAAAAIAASYALKKLVKFL